MIFTLVFVFVVLSAKAQYPYPALNPRAPPFNPQGSIVEGTYTYIDPTGAKRTVHYKNDGNGFNAVVEEEPKKPEKKKEEDEDNGTTTVPNKEDNSTTTPTPDSQDDSQPKDKKDKGKNKENDKDKNKPESVRYVPVPVFPQVPQLSSRSFAPYNPYAGYPYGFRPNFG